MKIYTRTGDEGETSLFGGGRVPKDALRIEAYGAVDELNAALGVARSVAASDDPIESEHCYCSDVSRVGVVVLVGRVGDPGIDLNDVWFPRLPRQDSFRHEWERLGTALSLEYQPSESFNAGLTWLRSELQQDVAAYNSFAQFRTNAGHGFPAITPTEVEIVEETTGNNAIINHHRFNIGAGERVQFIGGARDHDPRRGGENRRSIGRERERAIDGAVWQATTALSASRSAEFITFILIRH